ncbi:hypothetical protein [Acidicapsa acidisoli]|uniref:hypothetical protein n=1 Tax=Acidicapsa acidisoli TaxID=1615681 RepID=UPI0021E085AD|nr:hypothetical protein [Acidicapsa acidisoli]
MNQIAATMPEAKYRTTKKHVQPVRSIRTSEFAQELQAIKPAQPKAADKAARATSKKSGINFAAIWPAAVGLLLTGFAPEWQAMASQIGVWAVRFAFPFALLATHREVGIDAQMATVLPQMALYAQLPLDGLLVAVMLTRSKSLKATVVQLLLVHAVCAFVLWLLTFSAK